jgi:hypothetical protein
MALGLLGTVVTAGVGIYLVNRGVDKAKEVANKFEQAGETAKASTDLKEIGRAAHEYESRTGFFPRSYHFPDDGKKPPEDAAARLSWRYSLLPYVGEPDLYKRFAQDQPWDGPANRAAAQTPVRVYCESEGPGSFRTRYRVFVGGGAVFDGERPPFGPPDAPKRPPYKMKLVNVTDGLSNTIFAVETPDTVPWAQHDELEYRRDGPLPPLGRPGRDSFVVLMCDGSTRVVKKGFDQEVFKKMVSYNGGEIVQPDW